MAEKVAYSQAASTGKYDKASGLLGKYDNVRRFWEDQVTGIFLRPALNKMVEQKRRIWSAFASLIWAVAAETAMTF